MIRIRALVASICVGQMVGCSGDDGSGSGETDTSDGSTGTDAGSEGSTGGGSDSTGVPDGCGDGMMSGDEVCDDGNNVTESAPHEGGACAADCSLDLSLCGNGAMDPGEQCDDGNEDSTDACTTSCTVNDGSYHTPCHCEGDLCDDTNLAAGTIVGCENVEVPMGAALACFRSSNLFNVTLTYFAEGECGVISLVCEGSALCPPSIADYPNHTECPAGTQFIDKHVSTLGVEVDSKVCQKTCASDMECRWNAHDEFWMEPTEYRCQVTADSGGVRICVDARNNE